MGRIILPFKNSSELTLSHIIYTPKCDSNLIFLSQLQKTSILYHNHYRCIILKQKKNMIRAIIRKKNFFILNSQLFSDKAILVKGKWILTYLFSNNLQINLWHHRVKYVLNARIIKVSKLINNINIMIEDN